MHTMMAEGGMCQWVLIEIQVISLSDIFISPLEDMYACHAMLG